MKKEKTLRQIMLPLLILTAFIPLLLFAIVSFVRQYVSMKTSMDMQIQGNLEKADQCLDMELEKYETILFDFCTDDEMLETVKDINANAEWDDLYGGILHRQLSHIVNRNTGVQGITIFCENGKIIFYDRINASSVNTAWARDIEEPVITQGTVYRGATYVSQKGKNMNMIQIARRLVDYQDIHKEIGTVVLSVDESMFREALVTSTDSDILLCENGRVISSPDLSEIGRQREEVEQDYERCQDIENEKSGFTICNHYVAHTYEKAARDQIFYLLVVMLLAGGLLGFLIVHITKPYVKAVDLMVEAMTRVEAGDFQVRMPVTDVFPKDVNQITSGFNDMVRHIDQLIEQVKQSVVEQKNAELYALEAQIDPHFLYNALDTINWRAIENEQYEVSEMVGALAGILRYSVKNAGGEVSIAQELGWLDHYILFQSARLGRPVRVELDMDEGIETYKIHKLLLQPFVENAIKHGFHKKQGECVLKISMKKQEDLFHIIIRDNGKGMNAGILDRLNNEDYNVGHHLGIANVRKRLKLYYGEDARVYFESRSEKYTKVHLFINRSCVERQKERVSV